MTTPKRDKPHRGIAPGLGWRSLRRLTQVLAFVALLLAPLLGGWERIDSNFLSAWHSRGWDLPGWMLDVLPRGDVTDTVAESTVFVGGGVGSEYLGIPAIDPIAGAISLATGGGSTTVLLAWAIPMLLGLLLGRVFCGWFCPFGVLSRVLDRTFGYLPFKFRGLAIPERRPLRWVILVGSLVAGLLGFPAALHLFLPYEMLQQSAYFLWLLGGGGAVLGALTGVVLAGLLFGPTVYCATICPTGAALSLLGNGRVAKITIDDASQCGANCTVCDNACWLGLKPSTGDPGADCDLCTRCFSDCPKNNMSLVMRNPLAFRKKSPEAGRTESKAAKRLVAVLSGALLLSAGAGEARADKTSAIESIRTKPTLLLEATDQNEDRTLTVSVVDFSEVRLSADIEADDRGALVSISMIRGAYEPLDSRGRTPRRDVYRGPLVVEFKGADNKVLDTLTWRTPTAPMSAPQRTIFRRQTNLRLEPGATVTVGAVEGWLSAPRTWTLEAPQTGVPGGRTLKFVVAGVLFFGGLLSIAHGLGKAKTLGPDVDPNAAKADPRRT